VSQRETTLFLAPAICVLALVFAAPMLLLFVVSFWSVRSFKLQPDFSIAAWGRFAAEYGELTLYTLGVGLAAGALCTALGFVFAYGARFKAGRHGDALLILVLITLFGGYLVKIYAWKSILGADGLLNQALMALGLTDAPLAALIYSRGAVLVALVHFLLPFAILPQIAGGLFAAFAFCFLLAAGDYVTPMLLGGSSGSMLGQFVLLEFSTRFNWPAGAAMSFGLIAACLLVLGAIGLAGRRLLALETA
jgi:spermidine/putrescine transport system permease protein